MHRRVFTLAGAVWLLVGIATIALATSCTQNANPGSNIIREGEKAAAIEIAEGRPVLYRRPSLGGGPATDPATGLTQS